jgi:hypothetical protein
VAVATDALQHALLGQCTMSWSRTALGDFGRDVLSFGFTGTIRFFLSFLNSSSVSSPSACNLASLLTRWRNESQWATTEHWLPRPEPTSSQQLVDTIFHFRLSHRARIFGTMNPRPLSFDEELNCPADPTPNDVQYGENV